jgi:hypothetical protein
MEKRTPTPPAMLSDTFIVVCININCEVCLFRHGPTTVNIIPNSAQLFLQGRVRLADLQTAWMPLGTSKFQQSIAHVGVQKAKQALTAHSECH